MKININWEMNFFVYSLTTTSFFENKGDSYQINEAINYLDPRVRGIVRLPNLIDLDEAFYTHYLFLDS